VSLARDKERVAALTGGLALTIITWTFAAGYAPASVDALGGYSPWLYGPVMTAIWGTFAATAYLLIHWKASRKIPPAWDEDYRCAALHAASPTLGLSVSVSRSEKDRLAGVTAGLALTMGTWVAVLSFAPDGWMEGLVTAPPWLCCLASAALWVSFSIASYSVFRALGRRTVQNEVVIPSAIR